MFRDYSSDRGMRQHQLQLRGAYFRSNRWRQYISGSASFRSSRLDRMLSESIRSMSSSRRRTRDRIKAFLFSRPMSEKSVKKVVARIKRREELRKGAARSKHMCTAVAASFADIPRQFTTDRKMRK
uniref:Uncharacterized protein n=1 Tax=Ascaris lumbricoides TaxID=6252 RepID=A0A0M3HVU8_ASCLU